jgi:hypothetical protein
LTLEFAFAAILLEITFEELCEPEAGAPLVPPHAAIQLTSEISKAWVVPALTVSSTS